MLEILNNKGQMASPPIITGAISQPINQSINLIVGSLQEAVGNGFPLQLGTRHSLTLVISSTSKNVGFPRYVLYYETSRGKQPVNQSTNHPINQPISEPYSWQLARSSWQWFPVATRNPSLVS